MERNENDGEYYCECGSLIECYSVDGETIRVFCRTCDITEEAKVARLAEYRRTEHARPRLMQRSAV